MRDQIYIWLTVGIGLFLLISPTQAQEEQWLQYRSEREAEQIIGDMTRSSLKLTSDKPQSVELPDFECEEPLFSSWSTPMVESGQLLVALDRTGGFRVPIHTGSEGEKGDVCETETGPL